MSAEDFGERTEEATPEKRQRARDEGQLARSRDGGAVAATAAVLVALMATGPAYLGLIGSYARRCFQDPRLHGTADSGVVLKEFGIGVASMTLPLALAAAVGGLFVGVLEAGFHPRFELVSPKWERLDPISKLKQLFSPRQGAINVVLALLRVGVVSAVTYSVLKSEFPGLARLARVELSSGVAYLGHLMLRVAIGSVLALATLSLLDYGQSWWNLQRELRMTREELKEELRQQEGDPKVRSRVRARGRELVKRGIAKEVRRADVIVANPTHIAVALRYRPAEGAPIVTAKGYDEVALFMRKLAKEHGIVVVEDKPLARALAEKTKIGRVIPVDLYRAVAQVLAFVYRLRDGRWNG
jgi:flagellar biosynthetic protein FlhB